MTDETRFRATRSMAKPQPVPQGTGHRGVRRFEDPLAELARLIGQDDPFADFAPHKAPPERRRLGAENFPPRPQQLRHEERDFHARGHEEYESAPEPHKPSDAAPAPFAEPGSQQAPKDVSPYKETGFENNDLNGPEAYRDAHPTDADYDLPPVNGRARKPEQKQPSPQYRYGQPDQQFDQESAAAPLRRNRFSPPLEDFDYLEADQYAQQPQARRRDFGALQNGHGEPQLAYARRGFDHENRYDERYEQDAYAEQPHNPKRPPQWRGNEYDADYGEDSRLPAQVEGYAGNAKKGRNWVLISAVAGCLVILSVTGVVGYRALFGSGGAPKTIKAESTPAKVTPTPAGNTPTASEPGKNNDRVGFDAPPGNERIVSRQEEPVGRGPVQGSSAFAPPPQAVSREQMQTPPATPGEPKRVRTVSVRADGSVVGDQRAATAQQRPAANAPMNINSYAERDPGGPPAQQAIQSAPPPPQSRAPVQQNTGAAPANGNPWADITNVQPQRAVPAPAQQASVNNPPPVPRAPAPSIAVQTPMPSGSYVVQVASQKSEQEAQAAWQQVQSRYPGVLGNHQAQIRRVNLGERGTFFRAQLGPYSSRAQASEICESLKAAGGECIIQRN